MANSDLINSSNSGSLKKPPSPLHCPLSSSLNMEQPSLQINSGSIVSSFCLNRSRQRWRLLSNAVRLKQFNLDELIQEQQQQRKQSSANTSSTSSFPESPISPSPPASGAPGLLFTNNSSSSSSLSSSCIQQIPQLSTTILAIDPPLSTIIETYGFLRYRLLPSSIWIQCDWNPDSDLWSSFDDDGYLIRKQPPEQDLNLQIKLVQNRLNIKDLAGFDNSGNVRIWSSEEALSYLLTNIGNYFDEDTTNDIKPTKQQKRIICELGAGMTGLAGLICARLGLHRELYLTDGNDRCVNNIQEIVQKNFPIRKNGQLIDEEESNIHVQKLCWNELNDKNKQFYHLKNRMETIICADCLFRVDVHQPLLDCIDYLLVDDQHDSATNPGQALIMAPKRGDRLDRFIRVVFNDGRFHIRCYETFSQSFKTLFEKLSKHLPERYDTDTFYPYLLVIKRRPRKMLNTIEATTEIT